MFQEPSSRTVELLQLLQLPGVGPARARDFVRHAAANQSLLDLARRSLAASKRSLDEDEMRKRFEAIREKCARLELHILSILDDAYPARLKQINDAPPIIYVRGDLKSLQGPAVAVVGTRQASPAGAKAGALIARHLAESGVVVVSGLALGIDTAAHTGALEANGTTVAILAHGLDTVAPASNRALAERILTRSGALVSEHPPGVPPRPPEFARRNRIQSGMSLASVVVESGASGGAMIQAGFTRQQGRQLFAIVSREPGFNAGGAQRLVAEFGASAIAGTSELREAMTRIGAGDVNARPKNVAQGELEWR